MTEAYPEGVDAWAQLVSCALIGTARRPPAVAALGLVEGSSVAQAVEAVAVAAAGSDAMLLDVAALATVQRRAGRRTLTASTSSMEVTGLGPGAVPPALPETLPAPHPAATARLADVLGLGDHDLLRAWLTAAVERRRRVPPSLLHPLFAAVGSDPELAALAVAAGGECGRWFARLWPDPARPFAALAARHRAGGNAPHGSATPDDDAAQWQAQSWQFGAPAQRLAWLGGRRQVDPARALALLEAGWAQEPPDQRTGLVAALEPGLRQADEPFLERCLDERRAQTRLAAAALLARLPASRFADRMRARATGCLRIERHLLRHRIVVTPPAGRDAALARDGVLAYQGSPGGRSAIGEGAWLLIQILAATPLDAWVPVLGPDPDAVLGLDVADDWGPVLREGWARAAVAQRAGDWAGPLLAAEVASYDGLLAGQLCAVLDPADRVARLTALFRQASRGTLAPHGMSSFDAMLEHCPAPWPAELADAFIALLGRAGHRDVPEYVLRRAALCLPPSYAAPLAAFVTRPRADDGEPAFLQDHHRADLSRAVDLITYRAPMLEELSR